MTELVICQIKIRHDDAGRFCLNDMHRAAMHKEKAAKHHRPGEFLRRKETKALIKAAMSRCANSRIEPVVTVRGGKATEQGSFVIRPLAIAYAAWIDAEFHFDVLVSFDALMSGELVRVNGLQYRTARSALEFELGKGKASNCGRELRKWRDTKPRLQSELEQLCAELQLSLLN